VTHAKKSHRLRQQLAVEAARIMTEEGVLDFHTAKRKAADRVGVINDQVMPRNIEIELALKEYQAIFRAEQQPAQLSALRKTAITVMQLLSDFSPRLVGSVLRGSADQYTTIDIHLFSDNSLSLDWLLIEHHIPFNMSEREYRFKGDVIERYPLYLIEGEGDADVALTVFPERGVRQPPKSPLDGKSIQRASISEVQALLQKVP